MTGKPSKADIEWIERLREESRLQLQKTRDALDAWEDEPDKHERREPVTMSIPEFAELAGVHRNHVYNLAKAGHVEGIPIVRVGRRMMLPRKRAMEYLAGMGSNELKEDDDDSR